MTHIYRAIYAALILAVLLAGCIGSGDCNKSIDPERCGTMQFRAQLTAVAK